MVEYEYAKALFELAIEEKKTELFLDSLNGILDVISANKDFYKLVASPLVDINEKLKVVHTVFKTMDSTFKEFLCLLVRNNRFVLIEQITEEYNQMLSDYNSILKIEVISSEKLSKERLNIVTKSLEQRYPNKKLKIENTVNPKILSGLQIICNGESLDISLKNRLTKLKNSL
ncbi:MAG: ATP synthase F1 subunit delta [Anaeroplasmataceae bacterium]|nr:ATP synthase F1 subunit delta [Anaeroplasmataceae bacterium]MDE6414863.1 ATP synthase F1 subunit delta [Anaeroplasmataceae bacterium]